MRFHAEILRTSAVHRNWRGAHALRRTLSGVPFSLDQRRQVYVSDELTPDQVDTLKALNSVRLAMMTEPVGEAKPVKPAALAPVAATEDGGTEEAPEADESGDADSAAESEADAEAETRKRGRRKSKG